MGYQRHASYIKKIGEFAPYGRWLSIKKDGFLVV